MNSNIYRDMILAPIWRKFLVQLMWVVILFILLFSGLFISIESSLEEKWITQRNNALSDLIGRAVLESIIVEDKVGLIQSIEGLSDAIPEITHLSVFNETNQLLAETKKQNHNSDLSLLIDIDSVIKYHDEVFGHLHISRSVMNDALELKSWFFLMHWVYALLVTALLALMVFLIYKKTSSIMMKAHFGALHDPMTNLPNRRQLEEFKSQEYRRAAREKYSIGVILFDIDYFKNYNDYYGHEKGDEVIKKVANAINLSLSRASDFAARYGGEEFLVICSGDETSCKNIAERCRKAILKLKIHHKHSKAHKYVTMSAGYIVIPPEDLPPEENPIKSADIALYYAKNTGRNCTISHKDIEDKKAKLHIIKN